MSLYDTRFPLVDTLDLIFLVILISVVDSTTAITCAPITLCCSKFLKLKLTKNLSNDRHKNLWSKTCTQNYYTHADHHIFNFIFLTQSNFLLIHSLLSLLLLFYLSKSQLFYLSKSLSLVPYGLGAMLIIELTKKIMDDIVISRMILCECTKKVSVCIITIELTLGLAIIMFSTEEKNCWTYQSFYWLPIIFTL